MNRKPTDYTLLLVAIVILIAVIASSCGRTYKVRVYSLLYGYQTVDMNYKPTTLDCVRVNGTNAYANDDSGIGHIAIVQ